MENSPTKHNTEVQESNNSTIDEEQARAIGNKVTSNSYIEKLAAYREKHRDAAGEEIDFATEQLADLQYDFRKKVENIRQRGYHFMPREEFVKWEEDYANYWRIIDDKMEEMHYAPEDREGAEFEANHEASMFPSKEEIGKNGNLLDDSIEAQAGNFYRERSRAIIRAIQASDSETKEQDLETVESFGVSVANHLSYRKEEVETGLSDTYYQSREESRVKAHNDAIRHFNAINHIAKKYGATPLLPRDLWVTKRFSNPTYQMDKKAYYDHYAFQAYYENAFDTKDKDQN